MLVVSYWIWKTLQRAEPKIHPSCFRGWHFKGLGRTLLRTSNWTTKENTVITDDYLEFSTPQYLRYYPPAWRLPISCASLARVLVLRFSYLLFLFSFFIYHYLISSCVTPRLKFLLFAWPSQPPIKVWTWRCSVPDASRARCYISWMSFKKT